MRELCDFSKEVWEKTFKYADEKNENETFSRTAKAIASVEKSPEVWEKEFYHALSNRWFCPAGRILANAGTSFSGTTLFNCSTSPLIKYDCDSLDGIMETLRIQAQTLKSESGWGHNFSFIRPRGSLISGIGVESPGAVKYMELFNKSSDIITAGSGNDGKKKGQKKKIRKGAQISFLDVSHPDVEEFITAKRVPNKLDKFNVSVACYDDFMEKVERVESTGTDENWDLIFPDTTHENYKKEWNGNIQLWKSKGYPVVVHKTVSVKYLWDLIMRSTYEFNDPGIFWFSVANRTHLLNYIDDYYINSSNPSLRGDTKVLITGLDGHEDWVKIESLVGREDYLVKNIDENWVAAKTVCTGNKQLWKIGLENGGNFYCTAEHKWPCLNDSPGGAMDGIFKKRTDEINADIHVLIPDASWSKGRPKAIHSVEKTDEYADVYDITVFDETNTFTVQGGVLTGNCGEQSMPPGSVCDLSSLILPSFYIEEENSINYTDLGRAAKTAVRFLDNINDVSPPPHESYAESITSKRRIGLGIMGWGTLLYLLKIRFGSDEAEEIKNKIMYQIVVSAVEASIELAKEKGSFKDCDNEKVANHFFFEQINLPKELKDQILIYGLRNSALFSIQPTGNTGIFCDNLSGGCEPIFMHGYIRTMIVQTPPDHIISVCPKYWQGEFHETSLFKFVKEGKEDILRGEDGFGTVWKIDKNRGLTKEVLCEDLAVRILKEKGEWDPNAAWAVTTTDIPVADHVKDLAGWCKWIDASASKTVNVPNNYSYEDFKKLYLDAYKTKVIKGITSYRAGTMSSVLASVTKPLETKRAKKLPAHLHNITIKGRKYYVAVGLEDNQPYEIFSFLVESPIDHKEGFIQRVSKGRYTLIADNEILVDNLSDLCEGSEGAISRMVSLSLQNNVPIDHIVNQLNKTGGDINIFAKSLSRTLKKYIKEGIITDEKCGECGGQIYREGGCDICKSCGAGKCS